jgi:hypothetical protein
MMARFINLEDRVFIDTAEIVCVEVTKLSDTNSELLIVLKNGYQIETNWASPATVTQLTDWLKA